MQPVVEYSGDCLLISTLDGSCLTYNTAGNGEASATPTIIKSQPVAGKAVDDVAKGIVLCAKFSNSGKLLAICNDYKQILLYALNTECPSDYTLISSRSTAKKAVKLEFLQDDSEVLMADKFGDVTSFSVLKPEKEGDVILGHLSMLLDCILIHDGKYLVSADRDEKIRVTHYPNTYNIQAFCLGHTSYVTSLAAAEEWLVSASADSSVKLWNPVTGTMLSEVTCSSDSKVVQQVVYVPTHKCVVCLIAGSTKLVIITINFDNDTPKFSEVLKERELSAPALSMSMYRDNILALLNCESAPLQLINIDKDANEVEISVAGDLVDICKDLTSRWSAFADAYNTQSNFFRNLTKMNLDNVEEELARKGKCLCTSEESAGKLPKID